jgi:nicotinamidase/pyrazinamidase
VGLPVDVTDRASFTAFLAEAERRLGPLDVLVNNAGIMPLAPFLEEDDATTRRIIDVNVHGVLLGMKLALPGMVARGRGHVVNMASIAGAYAAPGGATYSASKHAVVGATEAVRGELLLQGSPVRVSYLLPYLADTELGRGTGRAHGFRMLPADDVAAGILGALRTGRVDVWLPRWQKPLTRATALLPRRLADLIAHALGADRVLLRTDAAARGDYERRVAPAAPGAPVARALLVVDVQADFLPGGALGVADGDAVVPRINELIDGGGFDLVVATRDWHPPDHGSFDTHDPPGTWPVHCVAGTPGAELSPALRHDGIDVVLDKGTDVATEGYSAFQGTGLAALLRDRGIAEVTLTGLATDYCVRATALDALAEGFVVNVDAAGARPVEVHRGDGERALQDVRAAGGVVS